MATLVKKPCYPVHAPMDDNGKCPKCQTRLEFQSLVDMERSGRHRIPGQEMFTPGQPITFPTGLDGTISREDALKMIQGIESNPIRKAQLMADRFRSRTQAGRMGIALRSACRIPMLNAEPSEIFRALEGRARVNRNSRLDKDKILKRIIVKPDTAEVGKIAGWSERLWIVYTLKYSKGVVAVTDQGEETKVFPQWSDLRAAILKSGWRIIK